MADKIWIAGPPGDLDATSNWSPVGAVATGDCLIFDGTRSQQGVLVDAATLGGIALTRVTTLQSYAGDLGLNAQQGFATGSASFAIDAPRIVHGGTGTMYLTIENAALTHTVILAGRGRMAFNNLDVGTGGGYIYVKGGYLSMENQYPALRLVVAPIYANTEVVFSAAAAGVYEFAQKGGRVTTAVPLGDGASNDSCVITGGELTYSYTGTGTWPLMVIDGGYVNYNGSGTLTTCLLLGGTLNMAGDLRAKTITTLVIGPEADFVTHPAITVTNLVDLRDTYGKF